MTQYTYKFVTIPLTDLQKEAITIGAVSMEEVNPLVQDCINEQAKDGWEPFYPFSFPSIWFRKPEKAKKSLTNG